MPWSRPKQFGKRLRHVVNKAEEAVSIANEAAELAREASRAVAGLAEEITPQSIVSRILSSHRFMTLLIMILLVSIAAAVSISLGLSLLSP